MQLWVITTVVKVTLKNFLDYVQLKTFSRGGYQQIQLDCQYLEEMLQDVTAVDGAEVEIMLNEVSDLINT